MQQLRLQQQPGRAQCPFAKFAKVSGPRGDSLNALSSASTGACGLVLACDDLLMVCAVAAERCFCDLTRLTSLSQTRRLRQQSGQLLSCVQRLLSMYAVLVRVERVWVTGPRDAHGALWRMLPLQSRDAALGP